jgi:hypothetical protein
MRSKPASATYSPNTLPRGTKFRLADVKALFEQMRDYLAEADQ